ncbi:MAG TPA: aryl-sulfate sulfotransferase, partial [bacterium]|nr:aryl-sulfate sulfotransferase [bacterium]
MMIAWERKSADDAIAAGRDPKVQGNSELWTDYVIEVKPTGKTTGEIVWEWHVWDHLVQDADPSKPNYEAIEDHPELIHINPIDWIADLSSEDLQKLNSLGYVNAAPIGRGGPDFAHPDWNHTNGISYNAELDQIVLSVLGFNEIWIIDHSTTTEQAASHKGGSSKKGGDLLYRWGNPMAYRMGSREDQQLFAQHDATWVKRADGTWSILVFNNGRGRQDGDYSSVDEILLPVDQRGRYSYEEGTAFGPDKPTWSYTAAQKDEFFSTHISGAQRLPNGNTLICAGDGATLFEVTESLEVVWKYVCPVRSPGPGMGRGGRPGGPEGDRNPMDTQVTAQSRTGTPPDLDTNSDGVVTYEEASTLPFMNKDVFKWLDQDGNGTLSQDELPQGPPNDRRGRGQRGPG